MSSTKLRKVGGQFHKVGARNSSQRLIMQYLSQMSEDLEEEGGIEAMDDLVDVFVRQQAKSGPYFYAVHFHVSESSSESSDESAELKFTDAICVVCQPQRTIIYIGNKMHVDKILPAYLDRKLGLGIQYTVVYLSGTPKKLSFALIITQFVVVLLFLGVTPDDVLSFFAYQHSIKDNTLVNADRQLFEKFLKIARENEAYGHTDTVIEIEDGEIKHGGEMIDNASFASVLPPVIDRNDIILRLYEEDEQELVDELDQRSMTAKGIHEAMDKKRRMMMQQPVQGDTSLLNTLPSDMIAEITPYLSNRSDISSFQIASRRISEMALPRVGHWLNIAEIPDVFDFIEDLDVDKPHIWDGETLLRVAKMLSRTQGISFDVSSFARSPIDATDEKSVQLANLARREILEFIQQCLALLREHFRRTGIKMIHPERMRVDMDHRPNNDMLNQLIVDMLNTFVGLKELVYVDDGNVDEQDEKTVAINNAILNHPTLENFSIYIDDTQNSILSILAKRSVPIRKLNVTSLTRTDQITALSKIVLSNRNTLTHLKIDIQEGDISDECCTLFWDELLVCTHLKAIEIQDDHGKLFSPSELSNAIWQNRAHFSLLNIHYTLSDDFENVPWDSKDVALLLDACEHCQQLQVFNVKFNNVPQDYRMLMDNLNDRATAIALNAPHLQNFAWQNLSERQVVTIIDHAIRTKFRLYFMHFGNVYHSAVIRRKKMEAYNSAFSVGKENNIVIQPGKLYGLMPLHATAMETIMNAHETDEVLPLPYWD